MGTFLEEQGISEFSDVFFNEGLQPLVNYNFMLRVEGVIDLPCKSVHSFSREWEYEYIQEGGLNDYVHMKRKPISKPFTFVVERYVAVDRLGYDPLPEGTELVLPLILFVSRHPGEFASVKRTYTFTGCIVTGKEYGELNAESAGLLVEKTTIAYQSMVSVTTPVDVHSRPAWKFDTNPDTKSSQGIGKRYAAKDVSTVQIEKHKKPAWKFDGDNPEGNGNRYAAKGVSTAKIEEDKKPAWEFNKDSSEGNGNRYATKDVSIAKLEGDMKPAWKFDNKKVEGNGLRYASQ